jgi:hypothetical protein
MSSDQADQRLSRVNSLRGFGELRGFAAVNPNSSIGLFGGGDVQGREKQGFAGFVDAPGENVDFSCPGCDACACGDEIVAAMLSFGTGLFA